MASKKYSCMRQFVKVPYLCVGNLSDLVKFNNYGKVFLENTNKNIVMFNCSLGLCTLKLRL